MASKYAASGGAFTSQTHSSSYDYISPLKLDLRGKNVLVTGAALADGVGYATAMGFVRGGASGIAVADIQPLSDELAAGLRTAATEAGREEPLLISCIVDITKTQSVQTLHDNVSQAFGGRIDILVNNAAHMEPAKNLLDSDPETYWRTWDVNVRGLFNTVRVFLPTLLATSSGLCTIVNLSSSGALSARPAGASYRTSKLALMRWTESLQLEYGDEGLLTYCVNPGSIRTQLSAAIPEQVRAALKDQPEVSGDTIAWLTAERREWLGGRYVSCPWDMEELVAKKDEIVEQDKLKLRMVF